MEHFEPGDDLQVKYGSVPMAPFMFQDDLINVVEGLPQARIANEKVNTLMKQRGLALNKDKSVCVIMGTKKQRIKANEDLKIEPLICGDFETKPKEEKKR